MKRILTIAIVMVLVVTAWLPAQVTRPEDLKFPPLTYKPPRPEQFRSVLANGLRTYMMEEHTLPMVTVTAFVNFGSLYDPAEKSGLSSLLAGTLIKGGTKKEDGPAIEEKLDFLGATLNFRNDERISSLTLTVLSKDLDEGLAIFTDVLANPEFRDESITIPRNRLVERLRQANDAPSSVLSREYEKLLYGSHALTSQPFKKTLDAITRQDLKAAHARFFTPGNVILVASGDFKKGVLQDKLNKLLKTWKTVSARIPAFSKQFPEPEPGVYYIQKEINQGYISMGHLGIEDTNPDYFAVQVMNFILGGGGFTSRITSKVRSDEGLAYNTGSRFTFRWGFPGIFSGYVQTKSITVGYAIDLIRREFERIRNETVAADEMETAKNFYLESFADFFATPGAIVNTFARREMEGKPKDYYQTYQAKISKVTAADVQRVAQKYIHTERMVILIVGNWKECNVTSEKFPNTLDKFGKIHRIFLVDYLTGSEIK